MPFPLISLGSLSQFYKHLSAIFLYIFCVFCPTCKLPIKVQPLICWKGRYKSGPLHLLFDMQQSGQHCVSRIFPPSSRIMLTCHRETLSQSLPANQSVHAYLLSISGSLRSNIHPCQQITTWKLLFYIVHAYFLKHSLKWHQ